MILPVDEVMNLSTISNSLRLLNLATGLPLKNSIRVGTPVIPNLPAILKERAERQVLWQNNISNQYTQKEDFKTDVRSAEFSERNGNHLFRGGTRASCITFSEK